jgi:hypothetical protein
MKAKREWLIRRHRTDEMDVFRLLVVACCLLPRRPRRRLLNRMFHRCLG